MARGYAVTHPPGVAVLPVGPGWSQLVYAASGVLRVSTRAGRWAIPGRRALWIPESEPAAVETRSRARVRTLYLASSRQVLTGPTRAVLVPPLAHELVAEAIRRCPIWGIEAYDKALLTLLFAQLADLADAALQLPIPRDPLALAVAHRIDEDVAVPPAAVVKGFGASRRTVDRRFVVDTGMTLARWHRRARLLRSLELLAGRRTVAAVARAVGFSTPSAFIVAYRREFGHTPGGAGG